MPRAASTCRIETSRSLPMLAALIAAGLASAAGCATNEGGNGRGTGGGSGGSGGVGGRGGSGAAGGTSATGGTGGSGTGGSAGAGGSGATGGASGSGGSSPDAPGMVDAPALPAVPLTGNGCVGGTCLNPTCQALGAPAPVGDFAEIGFETQPGYIPNDVIVPTFDDVPDPIHRPGDGAAFTNFGAGEWTRKLVEFLDTNNQHMDFFINTENFCQFSKHSECPPTLAAILKSHNPANHTVHHMHMGGSTPPNPVDLASSSCGGPTSQYKCDDEMSGVEAVVNTVSNGGRKHLTRFRAPYGEPFQGAGPGLAVVRPIVARYAVHVGWQIDSLDSHCDTCKYPGQKIADNVIARIGTGPGKGQSWGIVLMHSTYPWSYEAAKILFDPRTGYVPRAGFRLGTVEDVICWKYGKHSWELVQQISGEQRGPN